MDILPAGVFLCDTKGIKLGNRQALDLLGIDAIDELGSDARGVFTRLHVRSADTGERILPEDQPLALALRGKATTRDLLVKQVRSGHERTLHCAAVPLMREGKLAGAVEVLTDITDRRRAEEELRQAEKTEAIGRLAGGIAHDFNNIMMGILGYVHLLSESMDEHDPRKADIQAVTDLAQRAVNLTSQLLAFARRQMLRPQVVDANAVLVELERMVRPLMRDDVEFVLRLEPRRLQVKVDRGQLDQVMTTLLLNGRDAMPGGGRLIRETDAIVLERPVSRAMETANFRPGRFVRLAVTDTGVGLSPEARLRIFEPFPSQHERGRQGGMALASLLGIVHQSGGFVAVDSATGRGSTFAVYLPAYEVQAAEPTPTPQPALPASGSETLLVAEDEDAVREVVVRSLKMRGYTVLEARNAAEALHLLQELEGDMHLLVTDLVMPVMGGLELSRHVKRLSPALPILLM